MWLRMLPCIVVPCAAGPKVLQSRLMNRVSASFVIGCTPLPEYQPLHRRSCALAKMTCDPLPLNLLGSKTVAPGLDRRFMVCE